MLKQRKWVVIGCILIILVPIFWLGSRSASVDRFAPWRSKATDYAMLDPGARTVKEVRLVQSSGRALGYRVTFTAWGEPGRFVAVVHKGRYVRSIRYLPQSRVPKAARQTLQAFATPGFKDNG